MVDFTNTSITRGNISYGLHMDMAYYGGLQYWQPMLDRANSVNAQVSRTSFMWDQIEPVKGQRDWSRIDALVNELEADGIMPNFVVLGSPAWANGVANSVADHQLYVPTDPAKFNQWVADYADFMKAAAARYGDRVNWELWNEQNEHWFWKPTPNVDNYIKFYNATYDAIKSVAPNAEVAMGALVGLSASGTGDIVGATFLQQMYDRGVFPDIVNIHPYAMKGQAPDVTLQWENNFTDIGKIHDIMVRNGQSDTPMWVTEWGWSSSMVGDAKQAQYLAQSLEMLATDYPYVTLATYFLDKDQGGYTYGLFNSSGQPKASASIFENFVHNQEVANPDVPNAAPVAVDDSATTLAGQSVTIAVLANDHDPDGGAVTVTTADDPAHGTVRINADGTITYTPDAGYTGIDTLLYRIADGEGGTASAKATVTVNAQPNRAPTAANDAASVITGQTVKVAVLANDKDPDGDAVKLLSVGKPAHGTVVANADGTVSYTATAGYVGADSLVYSISDGKGGTASATLNLTVNAQANRAPVATGDAASVVSGQTVKIAVLANDTDPDGDALKLLSVGTAGHGTAVANADGTVSYTAQSGYAGADSLTYSISDGKGGTASATVSLTVSAATQTTVTKSVSYTLVGSEQHLVLSGTGNISGTGNGLANSITGNSGANVLNGAAGNDTLLGGAGNDQLIGGTGDDRLEGGSGADILIGGAGRDILVGGVGRDVFRLDLTADSPRGASVRDIITDFNRYQGDQIDLRAIDANVNASGNQAFRYIGSTDFLGRAGELHYVTTNGHAMLEGDTNGDRVADFQIEVTNIPWFQSSDVLL